LALLVGWSMLSDTVGNPITYLKNKFSRPGL